MSLNSASKKQYVANAVKNTVTDEDVNLVAQRYTNEMTVRVLNYHINNYSESPLGFLGSHRNLKVTLQRSNSSKPETVNFFVKSIPYECEDQADFVTAGGIFVKEINFLNTIAPLLNKHCRSEKWHATCYLAKEDTMIMEDLRSQGYVLLNKTFDDTVTLKSVLAALARFHSASIITEHNLNHNSKIPLTLNERYPGYFDEKVFERDSKIVSWVNSGADLTCLLAKNFGFNPDKIRKAYERVYDIIGPSKTYQNVIGHGDLWSNNIMISDGSPLYKCVFVDFQITRYGPPVLDILLFLHVKATRSYRDKHERDLLKFYHSVLKETIENNDSAGNVRMPTFDEILSGMDDLRLFGLVIAVQYFPIILMDPEVVGECTKDSESYNHFIFVDRIQKIIDHMKINEFYRKRIEEAVIELAEKCDSLYEKIDRN